MDKYNGCSSSYILVGSYVLNCGKKNGKPTQVTLVKYRIMKFLGD